MILRPVAIHHHLIASRRIVRIAHKCIEVRHANSLSKSRKSTRTRIMNNLDVATLKPTTQVKPADPTEGPDFVTALARGLTVIRAFGPDRPRMTLADIAKRVTLPRATVRRSLITLETLGYVESDGRNFSLSPKVLTLGNSYLTSSPFPRTIQPMLERLSETIGESCWAAIMDDDDVLLVAGAKSNRMLSAGLRVGSRLPAFCSAFGRVMLAALPDEEIDSYLARIIPRTYTSRTVTDSATNRRHIMEARMNGYAVADGEVELGLCSLAVPIVNVRGETVAAVNVTAPSSRVRSGEMIERFLTPLRQVAEDIRPVLI
jgi:IclR family transcriptional regulator, pca regulon regulatory protein